MSAVVLHFPRLCPRAYFETRMNDKCVYKSQFSLQWKSHSSNLHSCCSWSWVSPVCALALNMSFSSSSSCWTGLWKKKRGVSYSSHSHLVCLLSPPCAAVWLHGALFPPICCILLWVEWHLFCCFKTGDVFMSLIWVPLTKGTSSSHVGTVCWRRVTNRQISLSVWCYLHVIRVGNEHQRVIKLDWGSDLYLPSIVGQMII